MAVEGGGVEVEITADLGAATKEIDAATEAIADDVRRAMGSATSDFDRIGQAGQAAARQIEAAFRDGAADAARQLRDIGGADTFGPVRAGAEAAGESVQRSFDEASRQSRTSLAGIGAGAAPALAAVGAAAAIALGAVVGFGLKQAAALEQTEIGFEALLGSAKEAGDFIKELQDFAAVTPFEFPGLADAARRLLAVGEAAGITRDEIIPTLTKLGDLVAVLGAPQESLDRVVSTMGQIASKGKLQTEELLQLAEALPGFNAFDAIAKGLGVTTAEAQKLITAGMVPAKQAIDFLVQGMGDFGGAAGAMAKQAQTLSGLFSTFKDTITLTLTEAFQPLVGKVKEGLGPLTDTIKGALDTVAPALSNAVGSILPLLNPLISTLASVLGPALNVFAGILSALTPALTTVGATLGGAFTQAFVDLAPVLPDLAVAFGQLAAALSEQLATGLAVVVPVFAQLLGIVASFPTPLLIGMVDAFIAFKVAAAISGVLTAASVAVQGLAYDLAFRLSPALFAKGGLAVAIAAIGVGFSAWAESGNRAAATVSELTANVRANDLDSYKLALAAVRGEYDRLALSDAGQTVGTGFGAGLKEVIQDIGPAANVLSDTRRAMAATSDEGLRLAAAVETIQKNLQILRTFTGLTQDDLEVLAEKAGVDLTQAFDQKMLGAIKGAQTALENAGPATEALSSAQDVLASKVTTSAEKFDAYKNALDEALGVHLNAFDAATQLGARMDDLAEAYAKAGGQANTTTVEGRALRDSLSGVVEAAGDNVTALLELSSKGIDTTAATADYIARLEELKNKYPLLRSEIDGFIGRLNLIPPDTNTTSKVDTATANAAVEGLKGNLGSVPGATNTTAAVDTRPAVDALSFLEQRIHGIPDTQSNAYVNTQPALDALSNLERRLAASGIGSGGGGHFRQLAHGGGVDANEPVIVGDGGRPELFVPDRSGYVYPRVPDSGGQAGAAVTFAPGAIQVSFQGAVAEADGVRVGAAIGKAARDALEARRIAVHAGTL